MSSEGEQARPFPEFAVPRWMKLALIPGFAGPVLILGFIFVTELAHDEARCPYAHVSSQTLAPGVVVREHSRRCMPMIQEHRYTAVRGSTERVLGRRRFAPSAFEPGAYAWSAKLLSEHEIQVSVHNEGHDDATFREGPPRERTP
jgi:hypothetical protein